MVNSTIVHPDPLADLERVWRATERQAALIACPVEDVFYGGAMGGGKSDGLLGDFYAHAMIYEEAARGLLIRLAYTDLVDLIMRSMEMFEPCGAVWNWGRYWWDFPNGARLRMGYLDKPRDVKRYMGSSYSWIGADELTHWAEPTQLDQLRSRLRSPAGIPCYFRATGNPGFAGHNWVKGRYIDPAPPMTIFTDTMEILDKTFTIERVYIPSALDDNPYLINTDYERQMAVATAGDPQLFRAWRRGDWDIVAGGMFDAVYSAQYHVVEPFEIPATWPVFRSFDWGESRPFSVGWWARASGEKAPNGMAYPRGSWFRIDEWYGWNGKPNSGLNLSESRVAQGIKTREADTAWGRRVRPGPAGADLFTAQRGVRLADEFNRRGVPFVEADARPGSRKNGARRLRQLLETARHWPMEGPGLFIFENCRQWIRTVPVLPRDVRDPDDVDSDAEDHAYDETRYMITTPISEVRRGSVLT